MRLIILFIMINLCTSQMYTRIPIGEVEDEVFNFLYQNHLQNCFKYKQNTNVLLLKCLNNEILYDVHLSIRKSYEMPSDYLSISI
jgi:hypothetical protein